jgi:hypothetical protein
MAKKTNASETNPEWLSTYGILTAERILERFKIKLSKDELMNTLKDPNSRYYHLLTLPLKNIFNGILVNQVHDYQVYAQKLMIDYLLSKSEPAEEDANQQGTNAEEELKIKQEDLMRLGETFEARTHEHRELIAESQAWLIQEAPKHDDLSLSDEIAMFSGRAEEMMLILQNLRTEFRTIILDTTSLLNVVPDYYIDEEKLAENQVSLDFDVNLDE